MALRALRSLGASLLSAVFTLLIFPAATDFEDFIARLSVTEDDSVDLLSAIIAFWRISDYCRYPIRP